MTARPVRSISARRAARHPKAAYLVAADETTLAELEMLVATMPMCATGRVFVEVPDASWIGPLSVPSRMTVTWLDRSRRARGAGEALADATIAWSEEMLCDIDDETSVYVLASAASERISRHLTTWLEVPASRIHVD